jgi:hypothetical protein
MMKAATNPVAIETICHFGVFNVPFPLFSETGFMNKRQGCIDRVDYNDNLVLPFVAAATGCGVGPPGGAGVGCAALGVGVAVAGPEMFMMDAGGGDAGGGL